MSDRPTPTPVPDPASTPVPVVIPWPLLVELDSLGGRIALSAESIEAIGRVADLLNADQTLAELRAAPRPSPPVAHVLDLLTNEAIELRAIVAALDAFVSEHREPAADGDVDG